MLPVQGGPGHQEAHVRDHQEVPQVLLAHREERYVPSDEGSKRVEGSGNHGLKGSRKNAHVSKVLKPSGGRSKRLVRHVHCADLMCGSMYICGCVSGGCLHMTCKTEAGANGWYVQCPSHPFPLLTPSPLPFFPLHPSPPASPSPSAQPTAIFADLTLVPMLLPPTMTVGTSSAGAVGGSGAARRTATSTTATCPSTSAHEVRNMKNEKGR